MRFVSPLSEKNILRGLLKKGEKMLVDTNNEYLARINQ
jgi:hypothetical protein